MVKEDKKRPGLKPKIIKDKIIFRELGKTGIRSPVVNMGVMNADNPTILKKAYEAGIRHFDTAWGYQNSRNEIMVGNVIKEPGVRDKVIIATKIPIVPKKMTLKLGRHGPFHDAENQSGVSPEYSGDPPQAKRVKKSSNWMILKRVTCVFDKIT